MRRQQDQASGWILRARAHDGAPDAELALQKGLLLRSVARRGLPGIVEASLIPAVVFILTNSLLGARSAMVAVLAGGCASASLRRHRGRRVPSLVIIGMAALALRTLVGVLSGSTFVYFLQPVATTIAIAAVFVGSVLLGRPLIGRIAHDFCPIPPDVAERPGVTALFAGLTMVWAGAQILTAAATLTLLLSLDTALFVVVKPIVSIGISAAAVGITVAWALRIAHREELVLGTL